jgi:hypothetical protein
MMLLGCQPDNTDRTITCGIVVDLRILPAFLFVYLLLTQIESVIGPSGGGVMRRDGRATEEGKRRAERRGQHVRRSIEEGAPAATGKRS